MIILEEQTGLNAGLNRGLKIGKFIKRNLQSAKRDISIKNAIKVGKVAIPLATTAMSFIPGGGVASKLLDSKVGKLFTKIKNGKAVKAISKIAHSKVGEMAVNNIIKPTIQNAVSGGASQTDPSEPQAEVMQNATPTPQQIETIAQVKGVPQESLVADSQVSSSLPNDAQLEAISKVKDIPVENLKEEVATQKETAKNEVAPTTGKSSYVVPIVIGVGALGAILLASSSSTSNN